MSDESRPSVDLRMLSQIIEKWCSLSDELKRAVLAVVGSGQLTLINPTMDSPMCYWGLGSGRDWDISCKIRHFPSVSAPTTKVSGLEYFLRLEYRVAVIVTFESFLT